MSQGYVDMDQPHKELVDEFSQPANSDPHSAYLKYRSARRKMGVRAKQPILQPYSLKLSIPSNRSQRRDKRWVKDQVENNSGFHIQGAYRAKATPPGVAIPIIRMNSRTYYYRIEQEKMKIRLARGNGWIDPRALSPRA